MVWTLSTLFLTRPLEAAPPVNPKPDPTPPAVEELIQSAEKVSEGGDWAQAAMIYGQILNDYPDTPVRDRIIRKLGEAHLKNQDPAAAAAVLEKYVAEFPSSPELTDVLSDLAEAYIGSNDLERALAALERERSLAEDPARKAEVTERIVQIQTERKDRAGAVRNLLLLMPWQPEPADLELIRKRIEAQILQATPEELGTMIEAYGGKYPADLALLRQADLEEQQGLMFEADRDFRRFLVLFPAHPDQLRVRSRLENIKAELMAYRYRIGVLLPMAETVKPFSVQVLNGIRLAVSRFESTATDEGAEKTIGLVIRDSSDDPMKLNLIIEGLVREFKVSAMIGPLLSRNLKAVAAQARRYQIPVISPSVTAPVLPESGGYFFRAALTLADQARLMADYAMTDLGISRFCILYADDSYGTELTRLFRLAVLERGGEIIAVEKYPGDATDMGPQIRKIKQADLGQDGVVETTEENGTTVEKYIPGFDAIYLPGDFDQVGLVAAQLAFYDVTDVVALGSDGWDSPDLIRIGGRYIDGGFFPDGFFAGSADPVVREFVGAYQSRYQEQPTLLAAQAYDSTRMILRGIASGAQSPREIRDFIDSLKDFPGAAGTYHAAPGGELIRPLHVIKVQGGKFIQVN
jgi:ABC-type branched-subunit amino acid transport system substrate-binding protein